MKIETRPEYGTPVGGINFDEIFEELEELWGGLKEGEILSLSGRPLEYALRPGFLEVRDTEYRNRFMRASYVAYNAMELFTKTKTSSLDPAEGDFPWERHP